MCLWRPGPSLQAEVMASDLSFVTSTRGLEAASVRLQQGDVREAPQCRWDERTLICHRGSMTRCTCELACSPQQGPSCSPLLFTRLR